MLSVLGCDKGTASFGMRAACVYAYMCVPCGLCVLLLLELELANQAVDALLYPWAFPIVQQ